MGRGGERKVSIEEEEEVVLQQVEEVVAGCATEGEEVWEMGKGRESICRGVSRAQSIILKGDISWKKLEQLELRDGEQEINVIEVWF